VTVAVRQFLPITTLLCAALILSSCGLTTATRHNARLEQVSRGAFEPLPAPGALRDIPPMQRSVVVVNESRAHCSPLRGVCSGIPRKLLRSLPRMPHYLAFGVSIEAEDEARLELRATAFMLALMEMLDQPGVQLEAVQGDAVFGCLAPEDEAQVDRPLRSC
jgi:hypothetical protein